MPPEERRALEGARSKLTTTTVVLLVCSCLIALACVAVLVVNHGLTQHLLGKSENQQGVVTSIDEVKLCSRSNRNTYTVEWNEGGTTQSGTFGLCGSRYAVGDELTVWVADGDLRTDSPWLTRLGIGIPALLLVIALALGLRALARRRSTLNAALDGSWQPQSQHTLGFVGTPAFRCYDRGSGATRPIRRTRLLHVSPGSGVTPGQDVGAVPGVVHADRLRHGLPKGLCLHTTADGSRVWFVR